METNNSLSQKGGATLKVKKFRLRPRIPFVKKYLRSLLGAKEFTQDIQDSVPEEIKNYAEGLSPVAFYQTWSGNEIPESLRDRIISQEGSSKALSVSALVATIGAEPEEELSRFLMKGETTKAHLATALGEESADLAFQFIHKLLINDALQDDCEIVEPILITEGPLLGQILEFIEAKQENISCDSAGHLTPRFTRVGLAAWIPISKKKKNSAGLKRKK